MRTKNFLKHLIIGATFLTAGNVVGQSTTPGNVANLNTDFLGWDNTFPANNFPLVVKHELNQPIEWWTDDILRMRLHPTQTTNLPLIGGGTIPVPPYWRKCSAGAAARSLMATWASIPEDGSSTS